MKNQVRIVISYGKLRKRMMNDPYNYTEREVAHTVWRLLNVSTEIQSAFVAWFEHGVSPTLTYSGISFADIKENKHLNEFNTFLMMDLLRRDPDEAKFILMGNLESLQTLQLDDLRPELRERVNEELKRKAEEDAKTMNFDDRDEFVIEEGKSLVFKLNK